VEHRARCVSAAGLSAGGDQFAFDIKVDELKTLWGFSGR
jgi:hypothetical protein